MTRDDANPVGAMTPANHPSPSARQDFASQRRDAFNGGCAMWRTRWVVAAVLVSSALLTATPAIGNAQIGSLRKKAEEAKKKLEEAGKKPDSAKAKPDTANAKADTAKAATTPAKSAAAAQPPAGAKVWENYDFVPGNKVMFYTDFSEDRVGNFARGLKYVNGPMEIVERDDVKMMR